MRRGWAGALVLSTALLAGCTAVVTQTSHDVLFRAGVRSEFGFAAGPGRVMPVIVVGNPFPLPAADVAQQVVGAMQGNVPGTGVRFALASAQELPAGYAVVVLLDSSPGTSANVLCGRRGGLETPGSWRGASVLMAFCGNADARSWAFSSSGAVDSPDDPLFRQLIARTTFALLPARDDSRGRGSIL